MHFLYPWLSVCILRRRTKFFESVLSGEFKWTDEGHREVFRFRLFFKIKPLFAKNLFTLYKSFSCRVNRSMLMTACDLGAVTRPWKISKQVWVLSIFKIFVNFFFFLLDSPLSCWNFITSDPQASVYGSSPIPILEPEGMEPFKRWPPDSGMLCHCLCTL